MEVLIAGAGLGGLCLAHGLRQAGLDVQVLERRPTPADQPSSYGIHLNAAGLGALHACLPAANWDQLAARAVPARDVVRFYDQQLKSLAVLDHEAAGDTADPITRRRAISRGALQELGILNIAGRVPLTPELAGRVPAPLVDGAGRRHRRAARARHWPGRAALQPSRGPVAPPDPGHLSRTRDRIAVPQECFAIARSCLLASQSLPPADDA
jgi:choline dehydrogenase-like flavoprotein